MKITTIFFCIALIFTGIFVACGDDASVDCTGSNFFSEFSEELDAVTNAALAFANDESDSNCNALKDAYRDFIDAIRPYEDCALDAQDKAEFNEALNEAETELDNLGC